MLYFGTQDRLAKQAHEVVGDQDEVEGCFRCPEVLAVETVKGKVVFDFLDPVFGIRPIAVQVIHHLGGQVQVGDKTAVTVVFINAGILKKTELLSCCPGSLVYLLTDHDHSSRPFPVRALVFGIGDFDAFSEFHPDFLGGQFGFDGLVKLGCDDVVQRLLTAFFQIVKQAFSVKTAVCADQPHLSAGKFGQGVFQESDKIVGRIAVARSEPAIGHHPAFRYKGQNGVMGVSARFLRVIAFAGTLLLPISGQDRGVKVQGVVVKLKLAEKPAIKRLKDPLVCSLVELFKVALKSPVPGHSLPAEQLADHFVTAGDLGLSETVGPAPDAYQKLQHQLPGRIAPIGALGRHGKTAQYRFEIHGSEHLTQQCHACPGSDFFVGKLEFYRFHRGKKILQKNAKIPAQIPASNRKNSTDYKEKSLMTVIRDFPIDGFGFNLPFSHLLHFFKHIQVDKKWKNHFHYNSGRQHKGLKSVFQTSSSKSLPSLSTFNDTMTSTPSLSLY